MREAERSFGSIIFENFVLHNLLKQVRLIVSRKVYGARGGVVLSFAASLFSLVFCSKI